MTILVFDIETIPDIEAGRRLYNLENLNDEEVVAAMCTMRRNKSSSGSDFLPHYLQKIVAISLVLSNSTQLKVWSLGDEKSDEKELLQRFFSGIDKHVPTLVSWNGCGFDLPVIHYRSLINGICAPTYWESGDQEQTFRWNNYLNRFHYRHLDLMDILASYQSKAFAPLDELANLIGFPGKMGMSGNMVLKEYLAGNIQKIRNYCETDVLNTYGIYLRFELMRGKINNEEYSLLIERLKAYLASSDKSHYQEFLQAMSFKNGFPPSRE